MRHITSAFPFFSENSIDKILEDSRLALKNGVLTDGPHVREFEKGFADYIGVKYAIAVNSGTSALEIGLRNFNLKGREVIVPTNTFVASPNSVLFAGGTPVFADIKEDTLCIDLDDVKEKVSPRTAGVMVVHIAGLVCPEIKQLAEFCEDHDLFLLEDAAHAHGAMFDGEKAGALADAGCFSFYPTKVMTCGEGGMITTDDSELAEAARCMRTHGLDEQRLMVRMGHNWRMSEISAIVGRHNLEELEQFVEKRNKIAQKYDNALRNVEGVSVFETPANIRHSYYKYPIRLAANISREDLAQILRKEYNIETGTCYYPPCHLHPFYQKNFGTHRGDLPVAEKILNETICLPMHVGMSEEDTEQVLEALEASLAQLVKNGTPTTVHKVRT